MIIEGYWLKLMWAVLAGAWVIAALTRFLLMYLSWPADRTWKAVGALVFLLCAAFFFWRRGTYVPEHIPLEELTRNAVSLILACYLVLDQLKAVLGMAERRARQIQARKEGTT